MLESLRDASRQAIEEAVDMDSLEALRVRYLGKKGELTAILKQMGKLSAVNTGADKKRGEFWYAVGRYVYVPLAAILCCVALFRHVAF